MKSLCKIYILKILNFRNCQYLMSIDSDDEPKRSVVLYRISDEKVAGLSVASFEQPNRIITRHVRFVPEALGSSIIGVRRCCRPFDWLISTRARHRQRDYVGREVFAEQMNSLKWRNRTMFLPWMATIGRGSHLVVNARLLSVDSRSRALLAGRWNFWPKFPLCRFRLFPRLWNSSIIFLCRPDKDKDQVFSLLSSVCLSGNN